MPWEALRTRDCYAFDGWSVHAANFHHREAFFRDDLSCSGKPVGVPNVPWYVVDKTIARRHVVTHLLKMPEQYAEVWFLSIWSTSEWTRKVAKWCCCVWLVLCCLVFDEHVAKLSYL